MRISDWSADVCSSELRDRIFVALEQQHEETEHGGPEAGGNPCEQHRIKRQTGNLQRMAALVRQHRRHQVRRAYRLCEDQRDQQQASRGAGPVPAHLRGAERLVIGRASWWESRWSYV